jgi:hypothetical protein
MKTYDHVIADRRAFPSIVNVFTGIATDVTPLTLHVTYTMTPFNVKVIGHRVRSFALPDDPRTTGYSHSERMVGRLRMRDGVSKSSGGCI